MPQTRTFNALNGSDLKNVLVVELKSEMASRLDKYGDTVVRVPLTWKLELTAYPAEFEVLRLETTADVQGPASSLPAVISEKVKTFLDGHSRFGAHLTFPVCSPAWTCAFDVLRPEERPLEAVAVKTDPRDDLLARMQREMEVLRHELAVAQQEIRLGTTRAIQATSGHELIVSPVSDENQYRESATQVTAPPSQLPPFMVSAAGEIITGGPKPFHGDVKAAVESRRGSPIAVAAGNTPHTAELLESGVASGQHPPISQGGMGAPDAVRRAAGLPIPAPTRTKGNGIVDLPGDVF